MKKVAAVGVVVFSLAAGLWLAFSGRMKWPGVDEAVVEKFAREANRPPKPFIDMDQGDLLLFLFSRRRGGGGIRRRIFLPRTLSSEATRGSHDA